MNGKWCLGLIVACSASAQSYSIWLPPPKELVITPGYVFQTFDEYWRGRDAVDLGGDFRQHTLGLGVEYGLTENWALDLTAGYEWRTLDDRVDDGIADTSFGARYRWLDEETITLTFVPSVGVRVGGIIEGTYDEEFPFPEGDGASGAEVSLLLGKALRPNFGWFGDIGYRYRNHDVPDDLFGSTGVYANWKSLTFHAGYRHTQGLSGGTIGEVPFPKVRETNGNIEAGIGFADKGQRYYQVFYGHTLVGRNTGEKDMVGVAFSFAF